MNILQRDMLIGEKVVRTLVGTAVRQLRMQKGISQENLADLTDLHRNYISNIERGLHSISLYNFYRITMVLGVNPTEFLQHVLGENHQGL